MCWLCNKVKMRKDFGFYCFWLYFVYQNFQNGYFRISLFSILFEVICGKWILKTGKVYYFGTNYLPMHNLNLFVFALEKDQCSQMEFAEIS